MILEYNKPQENVHLFVELLRILRIGKSTSDDFFILSKELLNLHPWLGVCTDNMLHIYPTLREVKEFNEDFQKYTVKPIDQIHEQHIHFLILK